MATLEQRVKDALTAVATDWKGLRTILFGTLTGTLADLTTTNKSSIVAAINEVKASATGSPPAATASQAGVVELADATEALAMSLQTRALTPGNLASITNVANGLTKLGADGKVAAAQLPSYVDDTIEVANFAALPGTGETGKIYVTIDNGKIYRWSGTVYAEISASPGSTDAVPEGATNLYFTAARADARVTALVGNTDADLAAFYAAAKA